MAELPEVEPLDLVPLFDPLKFNENHGPLLIEDYKLSQEELKLWAE